MKRGKLKKPSKLGPPPPDRKVVLITTESGAQQPFTFSVTVREYTRLRVGDVIRHDGIKQVVIDVSPSCARIISIDTQASKAVEFTPRFADKPVKFNAPVKASVTEISANSESEILHRLGRNWRAALTALRK